ncbi:molybdopterin-dependent oxidoreductase [Pokkaliibacter sp. CJK22405]|uniref:molybdopterin-dependent oxidoreductase n=1 Tax=Pokkaliibacter sp. CJK22405 TaxID=3384615 RepID=UPI003984DAD8
MMKRLIAWLGAVALLLCGNAFAGDLATPAGEVLLSVNGEIAHFNTDQGADFDRAMLEQLPQTEFDTTTPWTTGAHHYKGVLLRDVLTAVGASGDRIEARALNDYQTVLEGETLAKYPVLIAMEEDGQVLTVRHKGPLWVVFPLSDYPELDVASVHSAMIWQLRSLAVLP